MIFYFIGINDIITNNFIIDNTSKMISDFLDQEKIEVRNIYILSVALILIHTTFLNILNRKQSSIFTMISKILSWIISLALLLLLYSKNINIPIEFINNLLHGKQDVASPIIFLIYYIFIKYGILMILDSIKNSSYYDNITYALPFYRKGISKYNIENKFVPMGYYLFILSIVLYILIIIDFNYEWKITGLFLVFSTIILFESALYLSAPFAQYE
jgi:hypothetical protein